MVLEHTVCYLCSIATKQTQNIFIKEHTMCYKRHTVCAFSSKVSKNTGFIQMTNEDLVKRIKESNLTAADIRKESGDMITLNQARQWLKFETNTRGLSNAVRLMLKLLTEKKINELITGSGGPSAPIVKSQFRDANWNANNVVTRSQHDTLGDVTESISAMARIKAEWVHDPEKTKLIKPDLWDYREPDKKVRLEIKSTPKVRPGLEHGYFGTYGTLVVFNFNGVFYSSSDYTCREFEFEYLGKIMVAELKSDTLRGPFTFYSIS